MRADFTRLQGKFGGGGAPLPQAGDHRPIGVFDSGVGGLTVLRALLELLPDERFVYLGDTARLPYGTKSPETVRAYALQAARLLLEEGVKLVVIACNTASAVALDSLAEALAPVPVIGVIDPGARAGVAATRKGSIAVLATEGTVRGGAYPRAIAAHREGLRVVQQPCQLFVALAEEGWTDHPAAYAAAEHYLAPIFRSSDPPDTLLLGCTHFPVLREAIRRVVGEDVAIVDSAATTAEVVAEALADMRLVRTSVQEEDPPRLRFLSTDSAVRFARVGAVFLGRPIDPAAVEVVDLGVAPRGGTE